MNSHPDFPRRCAVLAALALVACSPAMLRAGEIYKSIDAQGNAVYSDQPDPSVAQQGPLELGSGNSFSTFSGDEARVSNPPPTLPYEEQPVCPGEGYLWVPGYWAWDSAGYYWVPGQWVLPPQADVLWTPDYWTYVDGYYAFHRGYWARRVGYYGGINYGFGYFGSGFVGGRWVGHQFVYNRAVSNVDTRIIRDSYEEPVSEPTVQKRASFGSSATGNTSPSASLAAEPHLPPTALQHQRMLLAARTPTLVPQSTFARARDTSRSDPSISPGASRSISPTAATTAFRSAAPSYASREVVRAPVRPATPPASGVTHPKPAPPARAAPVRVVEPK